MAIRKIVKVLDADLYLRLGQFVAYKGVGVFWIALLLERGKIPFDSLDIDDVKQLTKLSGFMLISDEELQDKKTTRLATHSDTQKRPFFLGMIM